MRAVYESEMPCRQELAEQFSGKEKDEKVEIDVQALNVMRMRQGNIDADDDTDEDCRGPRDVNFWKIVGDSADCVSAFAFDT